MKWNLIIMKNNALICYKKVSRYERQAKCYDCTKWSENSFIRRAERKGFPFSMNAVKRVKIGDTDGITVNQTDSLN